MTYLIQGSAASIAPFRQQWNDIILGRDHNNAPLYSAYKEVVLQFDQCTVAQYQQWAGVVTSASVTTITMLNVDNASFTAYSSAFLEFDKRPELQAGVTGSWSLKVTGIQP